MRFFIIAATIIHLSVAVGATTIGRCCENGEVLVLNAAGRLQCVRSPADKQQSQQLLLAASRDGQKQQQQWRQRQQPNGLPYCGKLSHLVQILVEDAAEVPAEACLELFRDEPSGLNFPVLVHCSARPRSNNSSRIQRILASQAVLKPAPRIVHLRKCCPGNAAYDARGKLCREANYSTDFRLLFDRLPSLDFIDVYAHGPPACHDAVLVDFTPQQIYLRSAADADAANAAGEISISIPQSGSLTNVTINGDTSCLDSYGEQLVARVCRELDYCEENACVRKCCSAGGGGGADDTRCAAAAPTFENFSIALGNIKNYGLIVGFPCLDLFGPDDDKESWWLDDAGNIVLKSNENSVTDTYTHDNACLEFMMDERGLDPMICLADSVDKTPQEKWQVAGSLQIISCLFLALTFMVYCCLPSLQNLHGKTLMCHVASLFVAYATLAANEFFTNSLGIYGDVVEDTLCSVMGYTMLLGFHSSFFWLNVMCFDIWWTFRGIREAKRHRQTSRFLAYCLYAWGSSLFFVGLTLGLQLAGVLSDLVGRKRCWFDNDSIGHVVFFLLPVSVTLVANLVFFIVTARRCSKVKAEINRAMANDKSAKNFQSDRSRLIMNVKLFIVMGIFYIFDNLSSFLTNYRVTPFWVDEVFYVVDVINSLQGVWIFILFVLKSKVYEALRERLRPNLAANKKQSTSSSNALSVNKPNQAPNLRKSASSTTITSCFLSTSN